MSMDRRHTARLTLAVIVLAVLCGAANLYAAPYYVAQKAANSSDGNPGSEAEPWKTLTHACEQVKPGDTVLVKAGVYYETLAP